MALKNWPLPSVVANTITDWVVPGASKEVAVVGWIICNTDDTESGDVTVTCTSSAGTLLATLLRATLDPGESLHMDTKALLAANATPDKLRVLSTVSAMSFFASGDES